MCELLKQGWSIVPATLLTGEDERGRKIAMRLMEREKTPEPPANEQPEAARGQIVHPLPHPAFRAKIPDPPPVCTGEETTRLDFAD